MALKQTRLVTDDVARLTQFYECIGPAEAKILIAGYAEIRSYGERVTAAGVNHAAVLNFEVADVGTEFERLQDTSQN